MILPRGDAVSGVFVLPRLCGRHEHRQDGLDLDQHRTPAFVGRSSAEAGPAPVQVWGGVGGAAGVGPSGLGGLVGLPGRLGGPLGGEGLCGEDGQVAVAGGGVADGLQPPGPAGGLGVGVDGLTGVFGGVAGGVQAVGVLGKFGGGPVVGVAGDRLAAPETAPPSTAPSPPASTPARNGPRQPLPRPT